MGISLRGNATFGTKSHEKYGLTMIGNMVILSEIGHKRERRQVS